MSGKLPEDRPEASQLLRLAGASLRQDVAPRLSGAARYQALLIAKSLDVILFDLEADPGAIQALEAELSMAHGTAADVKRDLRDGQLDGVPALHELLSRWVAGRQVGP